MSYIVNIEGFEGQNLELNQSFWTGAKLLVNGNAAPKGKKRGEMLLQRNDGTQAIATWKPQLFGLDVPQLVVDGAVVQVVEPLKWYQWLWGALPVVLVVRGGALGALAGMVAFFFNARVFRSSLNGAVKYLVTAAISAAAVVIYLIVGTIFLMMVSE